MNFSAIRQVILMHIHHVVVFLILALFQFNVRAETCKYQDPEGRVIYSNTPNSPPKGATRIKCFDDPTPRPAPAPRPEPAARDSDSRAAEAGGEARSGRVSGNTQKARDNDRRRILEQEIADETKALELARQKLAEQEAMRTGDEKNYQRFLDRVQPFRDTVAGHERNLEAIKREVANLK